MKYLHSALVPGPNKIGILFALPLLVIAGSSAYSTTPPTPSGLVAAYSFDEGTGTTVADASGNGNNGTIIGAAWTSAGRYGSGLVFDGRSALVIINDSASLHLTTAMTLEAWVNPSSVSPAWQDVIYKGDDNYYLEATSTVSTGPGGGGTFGGVPIWTCGPGPLAPNTWAHLAVTYDGATLRLYVNGVQVASAVPTGSVSTSATALQIGGDYFYGQYFQGTIDEVRVYNVALTPQQIQSDMSTSLDSAPPDTQPPTGPTPPSGVIVSADSASQITIHWNASNDDDGSGIAGYEVYRNGTQVATTAATSYADGGLNPTTQYCYTIVAYDGAGNGSSGSPQACTTTLAAGLTTPTVPSGLIASADSPTQITIQWTASTAGNGSAVQGYRVFRNGTLAGLTSTPNFSDTGLTPGTQYCYIVDAYDYQFNRSSFSAQACATTVASPSTQSTVPVAPSNLQITGVGTTYIALTWEDNSSDELGFQIERAPSPDGPWVAVGTTLAGATLFTDAGLVPSTTYYYRVSAFN